MRALKYTSIACIACVAAVGVYWGAGYVNQISGEAHVIDGDTIRVSERRIRIFGIDAPEIGQRCRKHGRDLNCGVDARNLLIRIIGNNPVTCAPHGSDRYSRTVATCYAGGVDIGKAMVTNGHAVAYTRYSTVYNAAQRAAVKGKRGIWATSFEAPWKYRQASRGGR